MFQFVSLFDGIENITNIIEKSEQKYLQNMQNTASLKKTRVTIMTMMMRWESHCILKIAFSTFALKLVLQHII